MIENLGNMGHTLWPQVFGHPQAEIKILRTFKSCSQAANLT